MLERPVAQMSFAHRSLLYLYFLAKPVYLWASGLPQISDLILGLFIVLTLLAKREKGVPNAKNPALPWLLKFVFYAAVINVFYSILVPNTGFFLTTTFFLVFNLMAAFAILRHSQRHVASLLRTLYRAGGVTLVVHTLALFAVAEGGLRAQGFFNNPNQLGYFALLVMVILTACWRSARTHALVHFSLLSLGVLMSAASLSRAAFSGAVVVLAINSLIDLSLISRAKMRFSLRATITSVLTLGIILAIFRNRVGRIAQSWERRVSSKGFISAENLDDRGYQRILDNPQYLLFGAGEGGGFRFGYRNEIHSLFGNILFSYGAIGLILFCLALYASIRVNRVALLIYLPILLYNISHNGIRHTILWMIIAVLGISIGGQSSIKHVPRDSSYSPSRSASNSS